MEIPRHWRLKQHDMVGWGSLPALRLQDFPPAMCAPTVATKPKPCTLLAAREFSYTTIYEARPDSIIPPVYRGNRQTG